MNIDTQIKEMIAQLGQDFKILNYVYNNEHKFEAGKTPVYYSGPYWDEQEIVAAVKSLLTGKWLSSGENVYRFENKFSEKINQKFGVMVNSGSSANLVMLAALKKYFKWQDDDEIIVSVVGFPTTIAPIVQNNLKPVFVDIELDTLNFDTLLIPNKITDKTRAIFVSPVLGNPPDIYYLLALCREYKLHLILDNCDSLGSKWNGQFLNEFAVASSYSFYPAHHITTGEGGMVTSNNEEIIKIARSISWWGRECHPSGTKIYTQDGIKNIENISSDDYVYTHTGEYRKVTETLNRYYYDDIYNISGKRMGNISSTKNHPFFIYSNGEYKWKLAKDLNIGDYLVSKIPDNHIQDKIWNYYYKTEIGTKNNTLNKDADLFRLIGYWLAEGSLASGYKGSNGKNKKNNNYKFYRVDFSFHKDEKEYISDVLFLMKKYFNSSGYVRTKKSNNGASILFKTRKGYEFFKQFFGENSHKKDIPNNFIHENIDNLKQLIIGIWRGDGSSSFQDISIATTSEQLFHKLIMILSRFYISPSRNIRTIKDHCASIVNDKEIIAKHNLYSIVCYGENAKKLSEILSEQFPKKESHIHTKYLSDDKKYLLYEITNIDVEKKEIFVYNLEVENDHSYHANGIVSHNCYCVGSANLLPNGTCGHRFDKWLENYDGIIDHKYVFVNQGYNLKPLDLQGAIGLVQLRKWDEIHGRRKMNKNIITELLLNNIKNISIPSQLKEAETSWFGVPIIAQNKELKQKLVAYLENNKIQTRNYFAGNILLHPGYSYLDDYKKYPNANEVLDRVFFIGSAPHYDDSVFDYIEEVLSKFEQ